MDPFAQSKKTQVSAGPARVLPRQLAPPSNARRKLASAIPPLTYVPIENRETDFQPDPDLWLYRDRTVALLKRYARLSVEVGRLPSLLGREFFRTRVTSYRMSTFEDTVIFVYDVERSLEQLDEFEQRLIATMALQDYSGDEAARLLNCARRTIVRRYPEALDRLSDVFLRGEILRRLPTAEVAYENPCQVRRRPEVRVSDRIHGSKTL